MSTELHFLLKNRKVSSVEMHFQFFKIPGLQWWKSGTVIFTSTSPSSFTDHGFLRRVWPLKTSVLRFYKNLCTGPQSYPNKRPPRRIKLSIRCSKLSKKIADILLTDDRNSRKHFTYASLLMLVSIFSQDYFFLLHFPVKSPINVSLFSFSFSSMYFRLAYQCHNDYFSRNILYLTIIWSWLGRTLNLVSLF